MSAAGVFLSMLVVVVAFEAGVQFERTVKIGLEDAIHIPGCAADQRDALVEKRLAGTAADSTADQKINPVLTEKPRQRAVPGLPGRHHLAGFDLAIGDLVDRKRRRTAEMLKNLIVFTGQRDNHGTPSPPESGINFIQTKPCP